MGMYRKIAFLLIVLVAFLCFLPATSLAGRGDILPFEPGDTLEEIRAKIKHNGYDFTVNSNWVFNMTADEKKKFFSRRASVGSEPAGLYKSMSPLDTQLGKVLPSSFD